MYLGIIESATTGFSAMHWAVQTTSGRPYSRHGLIPNNQWSFLVGTYDGTTSRAYLNGVQIWSASQNGTISAGTTYWIGTYQGILDGNHNFPGKISEVRIYNRALSDTEITQNYNSHKRKYGSSALSSV